MRMASLCSVAVAGMWLVLVAGAAAAAEGDPGYYVKNGDWHATLLASRQRLMEAERQGAITPMPMFVSEIVRGGELARKISVKIGGQKELTLYVLGAPEVLYGAGTWAEAMLIGADGTQTRLSSLRGVKLAEGQISLDCNLKSGVSGPLVIAGRQFEHGAHVYPNGVSKVKVFLEREYERLEAWIGIDDWVGKNGAVRFVVADPAGAARMDLWALVERDFADELSRRQIKWERFDRILEADWQADDWAGLAKRYVPASGRVALMNREANQAALTVRDEAALRRVREIYYQSREFDEAMTRARSLSVRPLRMAIEDLAQTFGERYPQGKAMLDRLAALETGLSAALKTSDYGQVAKFLVDFDRLQREAMLANPLLDFERMLLIRRTPDGDPRMPHGTGYSLGEFIGLPRQTSKHNPGIDRYFDWDNDISVLSMSDGKLTTLYKPERPKLINDVKLHWDADRIAFSMPGSHDHWHVFEATVDGKSVRQITPTDQKDVHFYDPCYLPNGRMAMLSTACFQGVPCNAGVIVGMLYTMNGDGSDIRQIAFEQDHDYCPTVLNDGRLLYMRWDYTDTPHVWNRMLFTCNPDGTNQAEYYGANSYWPNAIFYARAVPNHPTKVVGIVTGHHVGRVGELMVFDPTLGRFEADGVVQQIPGYGRKVEPKIEDKLTEHSWPKFLHPHPLSEKYFLVSCKPTPDSLWGIYLVDVFDNMTLIKELEGQALLEPIPLRKTPTPPVIPDRVKPGAKDAAVYLADVYSGPGMIGIPRGTVKKLRLFTYHFAYQKLAGIDHRIGADGPWEAKRVLGTVDVEADGSALFKVPAKTPFTVQPLDVDGRAVQLMRTWMTAMPGETVSCVGCHDNRGGAPPSDATLARAKPAQQIKPWHGPVRGFSFVREVQPVLDRHCVGCHNGQPREDGKSIADLRGDQGHFVCFKGGNPNAEIVRDIPREKLIGKYGGIFEPSYIALRRHVRVGGLESDLHLLPPMEFHADTSELIQLLRKGHHNVKLDAEAWDRLVTWIDLNAPCHGTWGEMSIIRNAQCDRRLELQQLYGGLVENYEEVVPAPARAVEPIIPQPVEEANDPPVTCDGWPFDPAEAQRRQQAMGKVKRSIDLGDGIMLELVRIPAGRFVMGDRAGFADERPQSAVTVGQSFWMGRFEISNDQYRRFDPTHDSRFEHRSSWIFSEEYLGWPLNQPKQPVVRVSWQQAMAFCEWLSQRSGLRITLPTEAQWEYACRAGSAAPFFFGDAEADFSPFANLADANIRELAWQGWRPKSPDLAARDARFNDGYLVTAEVGRYKPNPWGLHDMHGNAAEWTRSGYQPYPNSDDGGRDNPNVTGLRTVRGGSWFDRPVRARSSFRLGYQPYQRVFNVGFRIIADDLPVRAGR